jgi:hypothetical protein
MPRVSATVTTGAIALVCLVACATPPSTTDKPSNVASSTSTPTPTPVIVETTVIETEAIPFEQSTVYDSSMDKGTTVIRTAGANGTKTVTYKVTTVDGVETGRVSVGEEITTAPTTEVTAIGTREQAVTQPPASNCDPNYSGCVPIASDVDCEGGSGNGPAYVRGPVRVIGSDIYDLDRDNDGIACE